jgi:hypothetical protein
MKNIAKMKGIISLLKRDVANCVGFRLAREKYVAIPEITKNSGIIHPDTKILTIVNSISGSGFITCHSIWMKGLPQ